MRSTIQQIQRPVRILEGTAGSGKSLLVPLFGRYSALYGTSEFHGAMMKEAVQNRNVASVIATT